MNNSTEVKHQLSIPKNLFGRTSELVILQDNLDKAVNGDGSFLAISGAVGAGKTALVKELINANTQPEILFVQGKFGQLGYNKPYLVLEKILEQLLEYILLEEEDEFKSYQQDILNSIGSNGGVITNILPAFVSVIGEQSQPLSLGANETKNRFFKTLESLFSVFTKHSKTLVIFFDDLQWADSSSINLILYFIDSTWSSNTLIVGSYRDDELASNINLVEMLKKKQQEGMIEIKLNNLAYLEVRDYIAESMRTMPEKVDELTMHVLSATNGNPFYLNHYMKLLYNDEFIHYDNNKHEWVWDMLPEHSASDTDNAEHILIETLNRLDKKETKLLQYGVCLRDRFNLKNICLVMDEDEDVVINKVEKINKLDLLYVENNKYSFKHDRVLRAVKDIAGDNELNELRLFIARKIISNVTNENIVEREAEIAGYLNPSLSLLSKDELSRALMYNQHATKLYLKNGLYELALKYAIFSKRTLELCDAEIYRELQFQINIELSRCYYLNTDFINAKKIIDLCFNLSFSTEDEYDCFSLYKDIIMTEGGDYNSVVELGRKLIEKSGIEIPGENNSLKDTNKKLKDEINQQLTTVDLLEDIIEKEMEDVSGQYLLALLNDLWEAAYYAGNEDVVEYSILLNVNYSLKQGSSSESSFGYVLMGMIESLNGDYNKAYQLGETALKLNEKFDDKIMFPKVANLYCNYISYYMKPFSDSAELYKQSSIIGRNNGDYLFGLWATMFEVWSLFLAGKSLDDVKKVADQNYTFVSQTEDTKIIYIYSVLQDIIQSLSDDSNSSIELGMYGDYVEYWQQNEFLPGVSWLYILLGQYYCILGKFEEAYEFFAHKGLITSPDIIMFPHAQYVFYSTLSTLRKFSSDNQGLEASNIDVDENIRLIKKWSKTSPSNFEYQYYLLAAELLSIKGENWESIENYNRAIASSEKYGINYSMALTHEMKANFFERKKDYLVSAFHQKISQNYYFSWGAHKKIPTGFVYNENETSTLNKKQNKVSGENELNRKSRSRDFDSIQKFTKLLSQELDDKGLLTKTLDIVLELTEVDKGALILNIGGNLILRATADSNSGFTVQHMNENISEISVIPKGVVNYVKRSKNKFLNDSLEFTANHNDSKYFSESKAKSILCLPMIHGGIVVAILYLESRSSDYSFTDNLIKTIELMLTQMATFLNNTSLHQSLENETIKLKELADKLEVSESRFSLSTRYSEVGVWEWNIITNEIYWSEMIGPILGGPAKEVETSYESFIGFIHPEDRMKVEQAIKNCFDGQEYRIEHRVVWSDSTVRWVYEAGDVIRDENGTPIRMLGTAKDITERKIKEEEHLLLESHLQQAQKMEAIGQLTGGIAHDFNNLLGIILGYSELISEKLRSVDNPTLDGYLAQVVVASKRASELVKQMLSFSRTNSSKSKPINVSTVIKETITMLSSMIPSSIDMSSTIDENLPNIVADSVQLNQILINLCINARDAIGEKGEIHIDTHHHEQVEGVCSSCFESITGEFVEISVSDTANGMDSEMLRKIFTPFFTTKEVGKGTGMGLSMVHGILHSHNAHIIVETKIGKGSKFRLLFKPSTEQVESTSSENLTIEKNIMEKNILLVDDEEGIVAYLSEFLELSGYKVSGFTDSREALNEINSNLNQYDLIITDQTMPNVTGAELSSAALAINSSFPIIVCTGYSEHIDLKKATELGIRKLMHKPVSIKELLNEINTL